MAILSLLFKQQPKAFEIQAPQSRIDGGKDFRSYLKLDAVNQVQHQHEAEVTENPIEGSIPGSDHMDVKPKVLTFTGLISEAPIKIEEALLGNVAGAVGGVASKALGGVIGSAVTGGVAALGGLLLNKPGNRVLDGFKAMEQLQTEKIPVTLITGLRAYQNMMLTSFVPTESAENGKSLSFTATFREIRVVSSKKGNKKKFDAATSAIASAISNLGTVVAPERGSSILSGLTGVGS